MTILDSRPEQFPTLDELEFEVDQQGDRDSRRSSVLVGLAIGSGLVSIAVAVAGVASLLTAVS